MNALAPRLITRSAPAPEPKLERVVEKQVEQLVIKESVAPRGWRFVPMRDENNLIIEIIATPIE